VAPYFSPTGVAPCFSRPEYVGCYHEPTDRPFISGGPTQVTLEACAKAAAAAGSTFFGVQYPNDGAGADATTAECWYDLRDTAQPGIAPYSKLPDIECQDLDGKIEWLGVEYNHHGGRSRNAWYSISGE
jgi:hypothetical protein